MRGSTYHNPVYPRSCPDPYVLKYLGAYWGYCTGRWHDGRCFGVLHSPDLVHWEALSGAMAPLEGDHSCYWAPEVTQDGGIFYLYYSVGNEKQMHLRVATAADPAGPFVDSGHALTTEPFAIDAHVCVDADGSRYLCYATDFLEHPRVGTGTVMDRLVDPFTLQGTPRPITRAQYDWQIYDPHRVEKDGACWHTLEGPFVLRHRNRYYQMFSAGNWQNPSYGVGYAVSDSLDAEGEWRQVCDGELTLPILRTLADEGVIGPGHNSVVRGPDNRQLFCVYHRWDGKARERVMSIDRLEWVGDRLMVLGPTNYPAPSPIAPAFDDLTLWATEGGVWRQSPTWACQEATVPWAAAWLPLPAASFVMEISLRARFLPEDGAFGVDLQAAGGPLWQLKVAGQSRTAVVRVGLGPVRTFALPESFDPSVYHLLRLEVDGLRLCASLDDVALRWQGSLGAVPARVSLFTQDAALDASGFALTVGWQMPLDGMGEDIAEAGWEQEGRGSLWCLEHGELRCAGLSEAATTLTKAVPDGNYELVITARREGQPPDGVYGMYPVLDQSSHGPLFTVEPGTDGDWVLRCSAGNLAWALPQVFDPDMDQQFRFWWVDGDLWVWYEGHRLGTVHLPRFVARRVGLYASRTDAAFALVRVTKI
jgi:GH43 family beta-xylosidase